MSGLLAKYDPDGFFCELFGTPERPAGHTLEIRARLDQMRIAALRRRAAASERELYGLGITFTVYSDKHTIDRILPFDVIPRVISRDDWRRIEAGCIQRVTAINLFLDDIYHRQSILKNGVIPAELVLRNVSFRPEMIGHDLPNKTYVHVCGIDIVRDCEGTFRVLEDNARIPSGVSYVIENRHLTLRAFPDLADNIGIMPVSDYGSRLREVLAEIAPTGVGDPGVVLLSPGVFNSAYFEHVFLAREMGMPLVEGRDLLVMDGQVFMKTTGGPIRVDVIYRRIDDDFLDPTRFRPESLLGVPGIMEVYRNGRVALANAVGTGVADDKAIYTYMPKIIKYYLDQDPILPNVETWLCRNPSDLAFTLAHLDELVVKPVGESGGYGVVIGPKASAEELETCRAKLKAQPENYISQTVVDLSVCPTLVDQTIAPRHVDLRPFVITGKSSWVLPGGLTRVALREGSLIVNSSQGGGTKDTWVLE
ncbi:MAG: circularly permuted type 2 ATP-grasp protein [Alphaproteobacteria bacterium]|nr:circularly permuted type 2 ATP-grasp protein [Alphaproteobacteria bacterium]